MNKTKYIKKYNTAVAKNCEYIQSMTKVYAKPPKIINGRCSGYKNRYNNALSQICRQCDNFKEF